MRFRPRWDLHQEGLRRLGRDGLWAAGLLAGNQVLVVTTLILANGVDGGVIAYHIAFQVFLLPFALMAQPVMTALYPTLASAAHGRRWGRFGEQLQWGTATVAFLALPASALLVALAGPALRLLRLGNLNAGGTHLVSQLVVSYGVGLVGYSAFQLFVRASYAGSDTRAPTLVALAVAGGGSVIMAVWFHLSSGDGRLMAIGFGHSAAYLLGAVALGLWLRGRLGSVASIARRVGRSAGCAVLAGAVAAVAGHAVHGGRVATLAAVALGGLVGTLTYAVAQRGARAPELVWLRAREPVGDA